MANYCPHCGTPARLLFNLIACMTPACRNYDPKWQAEWSQQNRPRYRNNTTFGHSHQFLGNYNIEGKTFDLYSCRSFEEHDICLARFGDSDSECYYVDNGESEIGTLKGKVSSAPSEVLRALKEALKRFRKK